MPEFPKKPWPVTLRQLMAQVAGVTTDHGGEAPLSNPPSGEGSLAGRCERTVDGLQLDDFAQRELLFEPGTQYRPSSYGWILVSAAVEAAAHEPFFAFMRTQVFEPLGMRDTTIDVATETIPARAAFYWPGLGLRGIPDMGRSLRARVTIPATPAPLRSCPRRLTWCGSGSASAVRLRQGSGEAASCRSPALSNCSRRRSGWPRAWRPATALAGSSRRFPSRANPRGWRAMAAKRSSSGHDLPHDVSRTRARRRRDGQHVVRGHEVDCAEHRAGLRGTAEKLSPRLIARFFAAAPHRAG